MKRRNWLWFAVSAVLALMAGAVAFVALLWAADRQKVEIPAARQAVVVARSPMSAHSIVRADYVSLEERDQIPSGAVVSVDDVLGRALLRDVAEGEIILAQDVQSTPGERPSPLDLEDDRVAIVLPADDILSQWGAVLPGDHIDVLFTLDVILETPLYPEEVIRVDEGEQVQRLERDQSLDNVSVLVLQDLEVLQIIDEPQVDVATEGAQQAEEEPMPPRRALVLAVNPQDAVVLKYLRDSEGIIDVALRSPENGTLYDVEPVNINYLILRYGIVLPQPFE